MFEAWLWAVSSEDWKIPHKITFILFYINVTIALGTWIDFVKF